MRPVENYVNHLIDEIQQVQSRIPDGVTMSRLHLGGGTPTILEPKLMDRLLRSTFDVFAPADSFEFSVEVDPTDATPEVLDCLIDHGLHRASIGVQDFDPRVQKAIGREQSVQQTRHVAEQLRLGGVNSVNLDLLYGLPFQTTASLSQTIDRVLDLRPDRLALYGYAHVPWMSKRQIMIDGDVLPDAKKRFTMAELAATRFENAGYHSLGIDHFALPQDGLARAKQNRTLARNFQGYTDDTAEVLLGLGASAISKFPQGFVQNAVSTSAYLERIENGALAGFNGYALDESDKVIGWMVEQLMCFGEIPLADKPRSPLIEGLTQRLMHQFPDVLEFHDDRIVLPEAHLPLARIVASALDGHRAQETKHSLAI